MPEYINKEKTLEELRLIFCKDCNNYNDDIRCRCCYIDDVLLEIKDMPTADVVEIKRGHWGVCADEHEICASEFVCSVCKESFVSSELTDEQFFEMMKYCANCGAKMVE